MGSFCSAANSLQGTTNARVPHGFDKEAPIGIVVIDRIVIGVGVEIGRGWVVDGITAKEPFRGGLVVPLTEEDKSCGVEGGAFPGECVGVGKKVLWRGNGCGTVGKEGVCRNWWFLK